MRVSVRNVGNGAPDLGNKGVAAVMLCLKSRQAQLRVQTPVPEGMNQWFGAK